MASVTDAQSSADLAQTTSTTTTAPITSRQPPTATEGTAAAFQSPTVAPSVVDTPTSGRRRSPSVTLSPPILSPAYSIEQSQYVPLRIGRAASLQRAASSQRRSQRHPVCRPLSGRVVMAVEAHPLARTLKLITLQPGLLSISLGRLGQIKRLCRSV